MHVFVKLFLITLFCTPVLAQQHIEYLNHDPVSSDTHWLVAGEEAEVRFKILNKHVATSGGSLMIKAILSECQNCTSLEQERSGQQAITVKIKSNASGKCRIRLKVFEVFFRKGSDEPYQKRVLLGKYFAELQVFASESEFPSFVLNKDVFHTKNSKKMISLKGKFENAIPENIKIPVQPHFLLSDGECLDSPVKLVNQEYVLNDGSADVWSATAILNTFGQHSLASRVKLANGEIVNLYLDIFSVQKIEKLSVFPSSVPFNETVELMIVPSSISLSESAIASVGADKGKIDEQFVYDGVLHLVGSFSNLPVNISITDPENDDQKYIVTVTEETEHEKELKDCVNKEFDGIYKMNKESKPPCLEVMKGIDISMAMARIRVKIEANDRLDVVIVGADGKGIIVELYGPLTQKAKPDKPDDAPTGDNGGEPDKDVKVGVQGAGGAVGDFGVNGGKGSMGVFGSQGPRGAEGEQPYSSDGVDGEPGLETQARIVRTGQHDCPFLVLVFGADGGDGGDGGTGGAGGTGGNGGTGGLGGKGGIGGEGAAAGDGGSGGDGGTGGPGGPGGIGGKAGQGGDGGDGGIGKWGGDSAQITVVASKKSYVILDVGNGGRGGNGGDGSPNRGQPGEPGPGGEGGPGGDGGGGGNGNPMGAEGNTGIDSTQKGPQGGNNVEGSRGSGGTGGNGGCPGEGKVKNACDSDILSGIDGRDGSKGS